MDEKRSSKVLPLSSIIAIFLLIVILYWFFSGEIYRFYASMVFLFYSWTNMMWVSVIMLGIFQTFLMVPFRIIRLLDFRNIRDFKTETIELGDTSSQTDHLKRQFQKGNWTLTFYLLDFAVQLTTYVTIGRLFLTDFYNKLLNPKVLYSFVSYPDYPIKDRFFKIPYPEVSKTVDLGFENVIYVWLTILIIRLSISMIQGLIRKKRNKEGEIEKQKSSDGMLSGKYMIVYAIILFVFFYALIRNFPVGWEFNIFTGDVAKPNKTFNTVTAIATFLTLMWFGVNDILKKGKIARELGIPKNTVSKTQLGLFKDKLTSSSLIGLGAYFITNQIPCAFELSIFTLEVISVFSPLTLDKWILRAAPKIENTDTAEKEQRDVKRQFLSTI